MDDKLNILYLHEYRRMHRYHRSLPQNIQKLYFGDIFLFIWMSSVHSLNFVSMLRAVAQESKACLTLDAIRANHIVPKRYTIVTTIGRFFFSRGWGGMEKVKYVP